MLLNDYKIVTTSKPEVCKNRHYKRDKSNESHRNTRTCLFFLSHVNQKGAKLVVKTIVTSNHQVQQQYRTEAASNELNGIVGT